jgi:hypothetical protein
MIINTHEILRETPIETDLRPISVAGSRAQLRSLPHQFFGMMTLSLSMHKVMGTIS